MRAILTSAACAVALTAFTPAGPAMAASIFAPGAQASTEGNANNRFPFFHSTATRVQQVYDAGIFSALTGPETITQIAFRCDHDIFNCGSFSQAVTGSITLSTTAAVADGLNNTFATNVGADATTVLNGNFTLSSAGISGTPSAFDIVIDIADTFVYDPSAGSLLLDIAISSATGDIGIFFDAQDTTGDTVSRLYTVSGGTTGQRDTIGLVTQFTTESSSTTPVPLPPASALALAGVAALAGASRRRKGKRT